MGEVRGGRLDKRGLYPSNRVRSDFGPRSQKGGEPASYGRQRLDQNRRPGGVAPTPEQWRGAEVRNVSDSPYLVLLRLPYGNLTTSAPFSKHRRLLGGFCLTLGSWNETFLPVNFLAAVKNLSELERFMC